MYVAPPFVCFEAFYMNSERFPYFCISWWVDSTKELEKVSESTKMWECLLLVESVIGANVIGHLQLLHIVDFSPWDLICVLDGTFALFLIHDDLGDALLDRLWLRSGRLVLVAFICVLLPSYNRISQLPIAYRLLVCPFSDSKFHRSELLAPPSTLQSSFESVEILGCLHLASTSSQIAMPARPGPHHSHSCWGFIFAEQPHKFFAADWLRSRCHSLQSKSLSWSARTFLLY